MLPAQSLLRVSFCSRSTGTSSKNILISSYFVTAIPSPLRKYNDFIREIYKSLVPPSYCHSHNKHATNSFILRNQKWTISDFEKVVYVNFSDPDPQDYISYYRINSQVRCNLLHDANLRRLKNTDAGRFLSLKD